MNITTGTIVFPKKLLIGDIVIIPNKETGNRDKWLVKKTQNNITVNPTKITLMKIEPDDVQTAEFELSEMKDKQQIIVERMLAYRAQDDATAEAPKGKAYYTETWYNDTRYIVPGRYVGASWGDIWIMNDM